MNDDKRACFAFIAAILVHKTAFSRVYDKNQARSYYFSSADINTSNPSFFDNQRGNRVRKSEIGFYDNASASNVKLTINGQDVECYDLETASKVVFHINGYSIRAYELQSASNYHYAIY